MTRTVTICFGLTLAIACLGCGDDAKTQAKKKKREPTNAMANWHARQRNPSKDFTGMKKAQGLVDQLKNQSPQVRIQACNGLGKIGADAKHAIEQLGNMKRTDTNDGVRRAAAGAIDQIISSMKKTKPPHPDEVIEYHRKRAEGT